jgi:glycosyltransferase involved in cell wall biosynthesis
MTASDDRARPLPAWTVAQIGARESYAAARAFLARGRLNRLYTDVWSRRGAGLLKYGPAPLRAIAGRRHAGVPNSRVVAFTFSALANECRNRLHRDRSANPYENYLRVGRWFDHRVLSHLHKRPLESGTDAYFSYNTGALETLLELQRRGIVAFVDQMDAARVAYETVREEAAKWPGWEASPVIVPDAYFDRLRAEWDAAAGVVVNSDWTARSLVRQGVPREKLHIVPLAFEPPATVPHQIDRSSSGRPLTVLWLGNVVLQKGIQYLIAAARLLTDRSIRFVIVGQVGISRQAIESAPRSVEFVGRVTRDRTAEMYRAADVFVFPTLSDGFGLTQLEAMAHGLPVVATPNCGAVVEPGHDGLVVPAGDAAALAAAIAEMDDDRPRLEAMGRAALTKAGQFPLSTFADRLDAAWRATGGL